MGTKATTNDAPGVRYGLDNPHPLSQLRTELVWEGKYDEYGTRRYVDIAGWSMPLQKIETIDEPRSRAEAEHDESTLFELRKQAEKLGDFRNMLIWGDNKLVMASLLKDFKGRVDLIYIDPPFDVGADFTMAIPLGDGKETLEKDQSTLEMVAYKDMWGKDVDSYLHMMYERLVLMRNLLSDDGSIVVHCDWHVNFQLRSLLNEVFGVDGFKNEIAWYYYNKMQGNVNRFAANHDTLLWYSKGHSYHFYKQQEQREEAVQQLKRVWDKDAGKLVNAKDDAGKVIYIEATERTVDDVWRIPMLQPADKTESVGYATQKPIELAGRIIDALTAPGDLILDAFAGSGTTLVAAEGLRTRRDGDNKKEFYTEVSRRWIGCDLGRFSIHTARKRLIELQRQLHDDGQPYRAFDVYNLGRYERQWWQKERLKGADEEHRKVVLSFYRAEVLTSAPSPLLHGRKGGAFVHVAAIDSILTRAELKQVTEAAKEAGARQVNCLAWEFEMDLRLGAQRLESELGVRIALVRIPREIMEKNRTRVTFFEIATLNAKPVYQERNGGTAVDIKLTDFLPSLAEVPEDELNALQERAIRRGFDFIDFWAIDFDYRDDQPFKHHWQAYRLKKDRSLPTVSDQRFMYDKPGTYKACVKVVDTFGCDTSITVKVQVH